MSEILYRGKRKDNGEWFYGDLLTNGIDYECAIRINVGSEYGQVVAVFTDTIGEYTGLTDKHGKKIFEGDILQANDDYEIQGVVEWQKQECRYLVQLLDRDDWVTMDDYEWLVIGNIHDNPEMLKNF